MPTPSASSLPSQEYLAEYSGNTLIAVSILFIVLDTVFVALRYCARHLMVSDMGWDDLVIPLAWLTNVGACIIGIVLVKDAGVGYHLARVRVEDPRKLIAWAKCLYALEIVVFFAVALPKVSILLLYLRVFTNRLARMACYLVMGFVITNCIAYVFTSSLQCFPFRYQWNKTVPGGRCFDVEAYYKSTSAPNVFSDILMLVLPIPTILEFKATLSRKAGLIFVFLTGSVLVLPFRITIVFGFRITHSFSGLVGSCFRFANFFKTDAFMDSTWSSVPLTAWTIVEPSMCLIAACLLRLRPLVVRFTPTRLKARIAGIAAKAPEDAEDERMKGTANLLDSNSESPALDVESHSKADETPSWITESLDLGQPENVHIPLRDMRREDRRYTYRTGGQIQKVTSAKGMESEYMNCSPNQEGMHSMARVDVVEWPLRGRGAKLCDLG